MSEIAGSVAEIFQLQDMQQCDTAQTRARALETLESGGIVYLPNAGFTLSAQELAFVADASVTLPTRKERESRNGRPTIIYDPDRGKLLHSRIKPADRPQVEALLVRYAQWAEQTVHSIFPAYKDRAVRERTTYRPCERASQQGLHVDASYGRPTGGRGMLRVFCNIDPEQRVRTWRVGETFEPFARRYLPSAKLKPTRPAEKMLGWLGLTKGQRTTYDRLMEDIRGQVKKDNRYQAESAQMVMDFPAGAAWIAITDLVLHGAVSGQHSLDQTFYLPAQAMTHPERSSLRILERLTGAALV